MAKSLISKFLRTVILKDNGQTYCTLTFAEESSVLEVLNFNHCIDNVELAMKRVNKDESKSKSNQGKARGYEVFVGGVPNDAKRGWLTR